MMDMHWIGQSKKQIDIQKIGCHGVSSRRRLTSSGVTTPASGWTGKSGRPCFLDTGARRVNACRARSDSTWPTVLPRCLAISLAARRTSSSRSTVVRMVYSKNSSWGVHLMFDDKTSNMKCQVRERRSHSTPSGWAPLVRESASGLGDSHRLRRRKKRPIS